jgi:hypothetical protein
MNKMFGDDGGDDDDKNDAIVDDETAALPNGIFMVNKTLRVTSLVRAVEEIIFYTILLPRLVIYGVRQLSQRFVDQ